MHEYRAELSNRIERLLSGECTVPEFRACYYHFYLDIPDGALTDTEHAFFGFVQEMLDWTAEAPTREERQHGVVEYSEFIAWVARERECWRQLGEGYDQLSSSRN